MYLIYLESINPPKTSIALAARIEQLAWIFSIRWLLSYKPGTSMILGVIT